MSNVIKFPTKSIKPLGHTLRNPVQEEFGDRMANVRKSLDRINKLMSELKAMSTTKEGE